ncbi:hypothetical protein N7539_001414 [Penicillium diatomitis]|uniref:Uncharacterized protein n=1 Tax=Penicillium diatomitis TaxID=2819901 RepID=A0A9X0BZQ9_9EURO|nr:uncharacterized protein N7539_001414 [Penicillium diatomitis]KAJ5492668.1 hypothetical protein N7539_001414 [Penicillium diatomitis]
MSEFDKLHVKMGKRDVSFSVEACQGRCSQLHGITDGAFKGLSTVADVLAVRTSEGRESYILEWNESVKKLPFLRIRTPSKGRIILFFYALKFHLSSSAQCFKDPLRVYRIRGAVANCTDRKSFLFFSDNQRLHYSAKASEATCSQALDHQSHNTYIKYQSVL